MITFGENNHLIAERLSNRKNGKMAAYPKKWCISWTSFFDNTLNMDFCYAENEEHALKIAFLLLTGVEYGSGFNEDIRAAAFDCDGMIGALCYD